MPVALADALVAGGGVACIVGTITWLIEYSRIKNEPGGWGQAFFIGVGAIVGLGAMAWLIVSLWTWSEPATVLAIVPFGVGFFVVRHLSRHWIRPAHQRSWRKP